MAESLILEFVSISNGSVALRCNDRVYRKKREGKTSHYYICKHRECGAYHNAYKSLLMQGRLSFRAYVENILMLYEFAPVIFTEAGVSDTTTDINGISSPEPESEPVLLQAVINMNINAVAVPPTRIPCIWCNKPFNEGQGMNTHLTSCKKKILQTNNL